MKNGLGEKVVLVVAGAVAVGIGLMVGFSPVSFYASSEIMLGDNISLLNEIRAPAMVLTVFGVIMLAAVAMPQMRASALLAAAILYLSYASGRIVSLVLDGMPHSNLLMGMAIEIGIGLVCAYTYWRRAAVA